MIEKNSKNKKAQVAIFFIVALVIVAIVALFFFIQRRGIIEQPQEFNPKSYIGLCAEKIVESVVDKMLPTGGLIEPSNFRFYKDIKVPYFCQNINNYDPCINQHPMILEEYRKQILNYTKPGIEKCFLDLKEEIESRKSSVEYGSLNMSVELGDNTISIKLNKKTTITQGKDSVTVDNFDVDINNPLYDMALVAMDITSGEARNCNFEYTTYMILHKRWDISKFALSDSTKIYTIKDIPSGKEMYIAERGCVMPS
jgi:hypothetical protein